MKAQFEKKYKKQFEELQANILAYQDLLMIKELENNKLEKKLRESVQSDESESLKIQIKSLEDQLKVKQNEIGELEKTIKNSGLYFDEGLLSGKSSRTEMKRQVHTKIEQLNEFIRKEVSAEIHARYKEEITQIKLSELEKIKAL